MKGLTISCGFQKVLHHFNNTLNRMLNHKWFRKVLGEKKKVEEQEEEREEDTSSLRKKTSSTSTLMNIVI